MSIPEHGLSNLSTIQINRVLGSLSGPISESFSMLSINRFCCTCCITICVRIIYYTTIRTTVCCTTIYCTTSCCKTNVFFYLNFHNFSVLARRLCTLQVIQAHESPESGKSILGFRTEERRLKEVKLYI